jgi:hypothetical protein
MRVRARPQQVLLLGAWDERGSSGRRPTRIEDGAAGTRSPGFAASWWIGYAREERRARSNSLERLEMAAARSA